MSTRCKFSAYSEVVRGVIQLQVRHLVLQLKTRTLGALCLCDRCELIVSLSVEYVLELYRVRMKARGFYVKGVPCLPANQSLTMALYSKCVSTHRVLTLFLILEFFALICNNDRDQFFSNRDTKEAIFKDSK